MRRMYSPCLGDDTMVGVLVVAMLLPRLLRARGTCWLL